MAHKLIAEIQDRSGDKGSTSLWLPDGATIANVTTFAVAWATALNNIITGKILGVWLFNLISTVTITDNTLQPAADVEHTAKFKFRTVQGKDVLINLPAVDEDVIAAYSSDELDQADPQTAAFIAAMESGLAVTGGTIQPCDVGEGSIATVVFARESFKNSGKRG
jgi:hypothetical protein